MAVLLSKAVLRELDFRILEDRQEGLAWSEGGKYSLGPREPTSPLHPLRGPSSMAAHADWSGVPATSRQSVGTPLDAARSPRRCSQSSGETMKGPLWGPGVANETPTTASIPRGEENPAQAASPHRRRLSPPPLGGDAVRACRETPRAAGYPSIAVGVCVSPGSSIAAQTVEAPGGSHTSLAACRRNQPPPRAAQCPSGREK